MNGLGIGDWDGGKAERLMNASYVAKVRSRRRAHATKPGCGPRSHSALSGLLRLQAHCQRQHTPEVYRLLTDMGHFSPLIVTPEEFSGHV